MDVTSLPAPAFTTQDGVTQAIAVAIYLLIGAAAWLRAPRDIRTRVFLALAVANLVVLGIPTYWWLRGTDPRKMPMAATTTMMAGLGVGALLLFHLTQVFPRRRPWIRSSGVQMAVAYVLAPLAIAGLVWFAPANLASLTGPYVIAAFVFGFPLLVLLGLVLPVAGVVSLLRSHRDVLQTEGLTQLKQPIEWILLSQIGGGTLAILFAPVLATLAPQSAVLRAIMLLIWALSLLTPFAFAAAVWKFGLLTLSAD